MHPHSFASGTMNSSSFHRQKRMWLNRIQPPPPIILQRDYWQEYREKYGNYDTQILPIHHIHPAVIVTGRIEGTCICPPTIRNICNNGKLCKTCGLSITNNDNFEICACPGTKKIGKSCKTCGKRVAAVKGGNTVKGGTIRGVTKIRPSINKIPSVTTTISPMRLRPTPTTPQDETATPPSDPYDLMRKSRLSIKQNHGIRSKSVSPIRASKEMNGVTKYDDWICSSSSTSNESLCEEKGNNKSILDCNVSAYQLISKYLSSASDDDNDLSNQDESDENEINNKSTSFTIPRVKHGISMPCLNETPPKAPPRRKRRVKSSIKSILKKNSVDESMTSSTSCYIPTYEEFKQRKKQVQFNENPSKSNDYIKKGEVKIERITTNIPEIRKLREGGSIVHIRGDHHKLFMDTTRLRMGLHQRTDSRNIFRPKDAPPPPPTPSPPPVPQLQPSIKIKSTNIHKSPSFNLPISKSYSPRIRTSWNIDAPKSLNLNLSENFDTLNVPKVKKSTSLNSLTGINSTIIENISKIKNDAATVSKDDDDVSTIISVNGAADDRTLISPLLSNSDNKFETESDYSLSSENRTIVRVNDKENTLCINIGNTNATTILNINDQPASLCTPCSTGSGGKIEKIENKRKKPSVWISNSNNDYDLDIELENEIEGHYEMIRDPIYEEISEPVQMKSIFEGATKYDILKFLNGVKERGIQEDCSSDETTPRSTPIKSRRSSAEIERNDSGVGSETSQSSRSRWLSSHRNKIQQELLCEDCEQNVEPQITDSGVMYAPLVCRKCGKRRSERREIISELLETEIKYGRDLQIMCDEFYRPMLVAGLLSQEQLDNIFLNVPELLEESRNLSERLQDALDIALEQGDEDLLTVDIGKLFLDSSSMLHAFEFYCTKQGGASILLATLEKEKELLKIFLRVSQMENVVLRRMNLNSFLMVPVQRVTKYPLLLSRLYKATPPHYESRELLKQAQEKIESHLERMNAEAKDIGTTKLWRRISIINVPYNRRINEPDLNIKLRKLSLEILGWGQDECSFILEGRLLFTQPSDWIRKGRTIKLNNLNAILVTHGTNKICSYPGKKTFAPRDLGLMGAALLLLKEKAGRCSVFREPLFLDKCIICAEVQEMTDCFEVQEIFTKDCFIFKAETADMTKEWLKSLQYYSQSLGAWRKRRNALANIMMNGMLARS